MLLPSRSTLSNPAPLCGSRIPPHLLPNSYFSCLAFFCSQQTNAQQFSIYIADMDTPAGIYAYCARELAADINHIFLSETITATPAFGLWDWHQSDEWSHQVFGMATAFWHLLPQYYKKTSRVNTFPYFCSLAGTKSYFICQESFKHLLGLICSRLHLRATCQLPGLLHLPVKTGSSASCTITNASLSCW